MRVGAVQPGEKTLGRPYCSLPVHEGVYRKDRDRLFSRAYCNRTRGYGFKLEEGRYRLDIMNNLFTMRLVKHRHSCPERW